MIDWIATFFTILGTYLQTKAKEKWLIISFAVCLIGNILWGVFAYINNIYSMIITGAVFGSLNVLAAKKWYIKYKKGDNKNE